jgi:K+-transporting ATPase ATPase C chain
VTILAQIFFYDQATGSLIKGKNGQILGSKLIGQSFGKSEYFHCRPSAAGSGYSGVASGGTNLGPTSNRLILGQADDPGTKDVDESFSGVKQLSQKYFDENYLQRGEKVPVDAVTRSASGLDPHISLSNALLQARRVAKTRGLPVAEIINLVNRNTETRQFGILGEPGVNVLMLNLALEKIKS